MPAQYFLTEADARAFLAVAPPIAETHADRIAAQRRLLPVTTEAEREAVRAYGAGREGGV